MILAETKILMDDGKEVLVENLTEGMKTKFGAEVTLVTKRTCHEHIYHTDNRVMGSGTMSYFLNGKMQMAETDSHSRLVSVNDGGADFYEVKTKNGVLVANNVLIVLESSLLTKHIPDYIITLAYEDIKKTSPKHIENDLNLITNVINR